VSAEKVGLIPQCEECGSLWLAGDPERWRCYVVDDGPDDKLLFYCPDCAKREFGYDGDEAPSSSEASDG
jgi:predicted  nucleic acid-binding Zn-ribbon protein